MWFREWKEQYSQNKKEKAAYKPYANMMNRMIELRTKGKIKEMREFVLHNVMHEEMPHDLRYSQLAFLADTYLEMGAYETAAKLYDATFVWLLKDERTYDEGIEEVMDCIHTCNRPDLLQKWIEHYENQMDGETKRNWKEKISS